MHWKRGNIGVVRYPPSIITTSYALLLSTTLHISEILTLFLIEAARMFEFADLGLSDDSFELSDPPNSIISGETDNEDEKEIK